MASADNDPGSHSPDATPGSTDTLARLVSESIEKRMMSDAQRAAQHIIVSVEQDKVTLNGHVLSEFDRCEAEAAAHLVPGVGHVVNRLRVID